MKKIVSLLAALALFTSTAFAAPLSGAASSVEQIGAQTVQISSTSESGLFAQTDNPPSEKDPSKLILRIANVFSFYDYQSFDGTPLKFKEVKALLNTVPENQALMSKRTGIVIANWTFAAIAFTSLMAAEVYYFNPDLPHAEIIFPAALFTSLGAFVGEVIMGLWGVDLTQRAIDNYNFSVMGIPIPIKR